MRATTIEGRSLWFGLLAPPAAWALQEWLGWGFGERTCAELTPALVRWIVLGASVAALAIALLGMNRSWAMWHAAGRDVADPEHHDRVDFMAFGGFLVSTIFAIAIAWGGLSSAFLSDCGRMR